MSRRRSLRLRTRVVLLVLLTTIPAAAVIAVSALEQRERAATAMQRGTMSVLRRAAADHQKAVESGHRLLESISRLPALHGDDGEECHDVLASLLAGNRNYLSIGVATPDGRIVCIPHAVPPGFSPSPPGLAAVAEAWRRRDFAVSDYTASALNGAPMLVLAHAVEGATDEAPRVAFASLRLDWLNDYLSDIRLPPGSVLTVTDMRGRVLVRHPDRERWVGENLAHTQRFTTSLEASSDTFFEAVGSDGVQRYYASRRLEDQDGRAYAIASIGVPTDVLFAAERRALIRNILLLAGFLLVALAIAWLVARTITSPLHQLLLTTRSFGAGKRSARSGLVRTDDEIGQLARAFDEMADALQRRERELERSAAELGRQALVFATVQEGVVLADARGIVTGWNPGAEQLFGYSRAEALGQPLSFYHDRRVAGQREREILTALELEGRWRGEIPFVRPDGTRGISEAVAVTHRGSGAQAVEHVIVNRDVTDRKRAESALRESELSYRMLFNSLTELVYIQDLDGRFLSVNDAVVESYGYTREELIGQAPDFLADPGRVDVAHVKECFARAVDGELQRFEFWGRRKDGQSFPKEVVLTKAHYFGREVVIAVARDVSDQKKAEEALRRSELQLRHAQKMEAVGRLAAGVAHDFNNLLTTIRGNAELALMDLPADQPVREDIEQVKEAADTATSLTRQLLAFGRQEELTAQPLKLNEAIAQSLRLLQRSIGSSVELRLECAEDLWWIMADPGQVETIVMNLVLNAREAMPDGGQISVVTGNLTVEEERPEAIPCLPRGEYVTLAVHDTGEGIEPEVQQRIFEPFFTTKRDEKSRGTGLGLFTVYGLVQAAGGHVWVESRPGRGSTFRVAFPRLAEEPVAREPEAPNGNGHGRGTVLLVEDEGAVRQLTRRMLRRIGYEVLEASGGEEALRLALAHAGRIDVMLTDVTMPRMNGRELAERMAAHHPDLPVVYMSGYTEELVRPAAEDGPARGFLQKPFSAEGLARTLREALDTQV